MKNTYIVHQPSIQTIWDTLIEENVATENELQLITSINGFSRGTLNDVLKVRTGYIDFIQWYAIEVCEIKDF